MPLSLYFVCIGFTNKESHYQTAPCLDTDIVSIELNIENQLMFKAWLDILKNYRNVLHIISNYNATYFRLSYKLRENLSIL